MTMAFRRLFSLGLFCAIFVFHVNEIMSQGTTFFTSMAPSTSFYGCLYNGHYLRPGEKFVTTGPGYCHIVRCTYDSTLEELYGDCYPAMCVDARPTECCPSCPNGQNCKLPNGSILHGSEPQEIDGMVCQCPEQSYEFGSATEERHITAECYSVSTTTTTTFFTTTETYPTTIETYPTSTTTFFTTVTSSPVGCWTSDGNFMYPGEEKMTVGPGYCHILRCTYDSRLEEMFGDCIPAMCVDAQSSGCCPDCPNGQNCKLPNGNILHGSEPQEIDGMVCQCPEQSYEVGTATQERHITAECYSVSTTSTTTFFTTTETYPTSTTTFFTTTETYPTTSQVGCWTSNGNFMYPGEEKITVGPGYCHILRCTYDSRLEEMFGDCIPAMCVDARISGCCPYCPNGQNCRLPNGNILHGSEPQEINGMICQCPEQSYEIGVPTQDRHITAECTSTSTQPYGCFTSNGVFLHPGQQIFYPGPGYCYILSCTFDLRLEESYGDCFPAMCVDAQTRDCCPYCPNGQNCRLPNGSILNGSEPQEIDGMVCKCPETSYDIGIPTLDRHVTAECYSASTVSDTT